MVSMVSTESEQELQALAQKYPFRHCFTHELSLSLNNLQSLYLLSRMLEFKERKIEFKI